jgi:hypothetical protein
MTPGKFGWTADMQDLDAFQAALGLKEPWFVAKSRFDAAAKRLDIDISFDKHALFACPSCGAADCPVYDARSLTWRHLNFWQPRPVSMPACPASDAMPAASGR